MPEEFIMDHYPRNVKKVSQFFVDIFMVAPYLSFVRKQYGRSNFQVAREKRIVESVLTF